MSVSKISNHDPLQAVAPRIRDWRCLLQDLVVLFKFRVVSLLLLAAVGGAFLGAGGWPGIGRFLLIVVTGGMAASGASALNQYLERWTDGSMGRTRLRPLVTGAFDARYALVAGVLLVLVPSLAVLPFNPPLAFFLLLGAFIYVGVYTIWLKPRTFLNIVIGGAAGSAAVMSGGAAVGAWRDPAVIVLALLIFLWTPAHFWSLAILYREDYRKVGTPMLPTQTDMRRAAVWVAVHTVPTGLAALALTAVPALGWLYLVPVAYFTVDLFVRNIRLMMQPTPVHARGLFIASNVYLMVVLLAICLDTTVGMLLR